ncbi:MAG TPA: TIGR01777 family oxidoreductase [Solirubrobacteraceae bacterium]|nr:TIGR01777 family oxidoreductase [Solirubrobacteraceae bacterium]
MSALRVTVTGATGLVGGALLRVLRECDADVTVLSRDPQRARARLWRGAGMHRLAFARWDPSAEVAPPDALSARDAVVHLAGEPIAQRWSERVRRAIRDSRVHGTRRLVEGITRAEPRPGALVSGSAIGYYGDRGEEPLDESAGPGRDFLARVCVEWEAEAQRAVELGVRVVRSRTGVVLDPAAGALAKMLLPFRLGIGGPVGGGRQYVPWIHVDDLAGMLLAALRDERWSGPVNATAPQPATNRDFSHALGAALGRPASLPVPALALRLLYGEMAQIVTGGARVVPAKALVLGYDFRHPGLDGALRAVLRRT